jgi:peptidoglycan/LPS O-acetylase OafA/YrhL
LIRLGDRTPGRDNNTQLLRFLAATAVIVSHCYALTVSWTDDPVYRLTRDTNLGVLGVECFFVLSGFLVTQSWLGRSHLPAFLASRALRIYPALFAAVAVSILLAGLSSAVPWDHFLTDPKTFEFARNNALGWRVSYNLPGAFKTNPYPDAVNGSLWTLPVELRLYVGVAILGAAGALARRDVGAATIVALIVLFSVRPQWLPLPTRGQVVFDLALLFALGSLAYLWRERIPLSLTATAAGIALYLWNPGGAVRGHVVAPFVVYAVLVLAYHPRLQAPLLNRGGDFSYGLYVYAFPVQQFIMHNSPGLSSLGLFIPAFPVTLALAAASWHGLERPALKLKSRWR